MNRRVLAMVLAGGKGTRLYPLTKDRAKPAVPFGGKYRIVDFVLSNLVNSGVYSTYVLTQFKSQSLLQHLRDTWQFGSLLPISIHSAGPGADAFAGRSLVSRNGRRHFPEYRFDPPGGAGPGPGVQRGPCLSHEHPGNDRIPQRKGADATVAAVPTAKELSSEFLSTGAANERIACFHERRSMPPQSRATRNRFSLRWVIMFLPQRYWCGSFTRMRPTRKAATTSAKTSCPA